MENLTICSNDITNNNKSKTRDSGVELLRIIAILLICLSHAIQTGVNYMSYSNSSVTNVLLDVLSHTGQMGNIIFIICSSYFLIDSKNIKLNKIFKILFDSMLISILVLLSLIIIGYRFSLETIIHQIFPDLFYNMWFIPTYVLFYLIHPLLNKIINLMNKKAHLIFFIIFVIYIFSTFFTGLCLPTNSIISFMLIHYFVFIQKKYFSDFAKNIKKNLIVFISFLSLFIFLAILKYNLNLTSITTGHFYFPILLPMLLSLFNLFKNINLKSKLINYLASCSLFVYCFHENILLRSMIRPKYYEYALSINPNALIYWVLLCCTGMFVLGYIISLLYKLTLLKVTNYISKLLNSLIDRLINFSRTKKNMNNCKHKTTPIILENKSNVPQDNLENEK